MKTSSVSIEKMRGSLTDDDYKVIVLKFAKHAFTFRLPEHQYHEDVVNELFSLFKDEVKEVKK